MATTAEAVRQQQGVTAQDRPWWRLNWKPMAALLGALTLLYVGVRIYQQWAAWRYGLDATSPEFQTYFMNVLYVELVLEAIAFFGFVGWVWATRDRNLASLPPAEEVRRTLFFVSLLVVYAFSFYWAGSFFAEQDATWHQTVVRDTEFTPSHIFLFYMTMPVFIIIGASVFSYAVTRLPFYSRQISLPLVLVVTGPFMLFPWVGMNEWGHAFWITEEWFTVPFHWGFAVFGWAIVGLGGVLVQVVGRLIEVLPQLLTDSESGADTTGRV